MGNSRKIWEQLVAESGLDTQIVPGQPITEISGDRRVLIENHLGVIAYSKEKIRIRVKFGCICVCGCGLELLRMSKEQLIIQGNIQCVSLHREGRK